MNLQTKFLNFEIDENGENAGFIIRGKEDSAARGSDYFRLILDDGLRTEIPIMSHKQTGKAEMVGDKRDKFRVCRLASADVNCISEI